jgi:hypothetical protein
MAFPFNELFQMTKKLARRMLLPLILAIMASSQTVALVIANPVFWPSTPILDKPTLIIESPTNNTIYENSELYINLTVTEPASWKREGTMAIPSFYARVDYINASLDGNIVFSSDYSPDVNYSAIKIWGDDDSSHYSIPQQPSPGPHVLNVTVLSYSFYRGPAYNGSHIQSDITSTSGPVYQYPLVVSDIVYFTVEQPTTPTPDINTQPTSPASSTWIILLITILAIVVIVAVLLYRRKNHQTP